MQGMAAVRSSIENATKYFVQQSIILYVEHTNEGIEKGQQSAVGSQQSKTERNTHLRC
jgi:hypothetical protein